MDELPPAVPVTGDPQQVFQLLRWILVVVVGYAVSNTAIALFFGDWAFGVVALSVSVYAAVVVVARWMVRQGQQQRGLALMMGGLLAISVVGSLALPLIAPGAILIPLLGIAAILPYQEGRRGILLSSVTILVMLSMMLIGDFVPSTTITPRWLQDLVRWSTVPTVAAIILLLLWQFRGRLTATLRTVQQGNEALLVSQRDLERQVADRTRALQQALSEVEERAQTQERLLAENRAQRTVIQGLSVPILPVSDTILVVPLIGDLDPARLAVVRAEVLTTISRQQTQWLIMDITGVPLVDSVIAADLLQIIQACGLLGTQVRVVGIRPEVAQALVGIGLSLDQLHTAGTLQQGIALTRYVA